MFGLIVKKSQLNDGTCHSCLVMAEMTGQLDKVKIYVSNDAINPESTEFPCMIKKLENSEITHFSGINTICSQLFLTMDNQKIADVVKTIITKCQSNCQDEIYIQTLNVLKTLQVLHNSISVREQIESAFCCALNSIDLYQQYSLNQKTSTEQLCKVTATGRAPYNYQMSFALKILPLFKKNGHKEAPFNNPIAIGRHVMSLVDKSMIGVDKMDTSGPGFIMMSMNNDFVSKRLHQSLVDGIPKPSIVSKNIAIDYSSPNIAKELHVGHLRSTVIGDTLGNILEFCGNKVTRYNHIGDWGTQFGMLIANIKDMYGDIDEVAKLNIHELSQIYKKSKQRFDSEPEFKKVAHNEVVLLQKGDETSVKIWQTFCDVSIKAFEDIYSRLSISKNLKVVGESFYNDKVEPMISELETLGLIKVEEGKTIFDLPEYEKLMVIKKANGSYCYSSNDLAAIKYRLVDCNFDRIVYVVDGSQELHFRMVFDAAKKAGWLTDDKSVQHCKFGLVLGSDGTKIKSRDGESLPLTDLLNSACKKSYEGLKAHIQAEKERLEDGILELEQKKSSAMNEAVITELNATIDNYTQRIKEINDRPDEDIQRTSDILAYSGLKYFDMSRILKKNYKFDYAKMLNVNGDTAVYLQYTYARMMSIIRKSKINIEKIKENRIFLGDKSELDLAIQLMHIPYVLKEVCDTLELLPLCKYTRSICIQFSTFYRNCKVIGSEHETSRLLIVYVTSQILKQVMTLFGMNVVDKI